MQMEKNPERCGSKNAICTIQKSHHDRHVYHSQSWFMTEATAHVVLIGRARTASFGERW